MKNFRASLIVGVLLICAVVPVAAQTGVSGTWEGAIILPAGELGILVHFTGHGDSLRASIDIPQQMARGIPLSNVRAKIPSVHFELPAGPGLAVFEGTLAGDSITGSFRQGGFAGTFRVRRSERAPEAVLPPPPYREEEVSVHNGDITLVGTLSLPPSGGPYPAAILLTGSGAQNRDEEIFGFKPFKIIADALTRHGFAVLRCDDRGVGASTGSMITSTTGDFAADALAMLSFLQKRPDIRPSQIGLIGHSEGAEAAAICGTRSRDVAFLVLLAGPALRGDSVILSQIQILGRLQGLSEEAIARGLSLQRRVFATVNAQSGWDELRSLLSDEMRRSVVGMTPEQRAAFGNEDSVIHARVGIQMNALRTPWFAYFISHDPAADLEAVHCPVLALFGELDKQVLPSLHKPAMSGALARGGNPDVTTMTIPGANHLFQKAVTGNPTEYGTLKKEFTEGVLEEMVKWLAQRCP